MDENSIRDIISLLGLGISLFLLAIHIKNRQTQLHSYQLARAVYRNSEIELRYLNSERLEDEVLLKFAFFNPGSIAAIIQSFAIFEQVKTNNPFLRFFRPREWRRIENACWWPTENADQKSQKFLADEYANLYVKDQRILLAKIPGPRDGRPYRFEIRTSLGGKEIETTIDERAIHFSYHYARWYHND